MTAPPRVLHLHFGKEGGAERFFVNLAQAFARRGVDQQFVIRPHRSWRAEIAPLGPILENNFRRLTPKGLLLHGQVRRLCRQWQPDAIMAWMPRAARLIPDLPDVVTLTRLGDFPRHLNHFGHCDVLVGNTPDIGRHCVEMGWSKPMLTISNFARPVAPRPVARVAHDTPEDAFLIAGAGRFVTRKGMDLLIRAAAQLPDAWLWLIGDGKERPALEALARAEGIAERTRFIGWVDEPIHHIAAADALGMPSRHEPLGNVVLEAWQAGVPVVSTRSEGPAWYMADGVNGRLVGIDDLTAFAAALQGLRDDPSLRTRLAEGGRRQLEAFFSEEQVVQSYLSVFAGDFTDRSARAT